MAQINVVTPQCSNYGDVGRLNFCHDSAFKDEFYNMDRKYRGKALIFSHDIFDIKAHPRNGNDKDWKRLEKCLKDLSFSVDVFHNLKYSDIMKEIEKTAKKMNHSENDCLLIAVLTHGHSHAQLFARDKIYEAEKLWCPFTDENCPTLAGKPRLFIIQACQGDSLDDGITLESHNDETDGWFESNKVPDHPDFLVALSSVPGFYSWRNTDDGSWFIQALCEQLEKSATEMDILTLLTFVSQKVALDCESIKCRYDYMKYKKEVPYFSSMLTRRLVFPRNRECDKIDGSLISTPSSDKSFVDFFKQCFPF